MRKDCSTSGFNCLLRLNWNQESVLNAVAGLLPHTTKSVQAAATDKGICVMHFKAVVVLFGLIGLLLRTCFK